MNRCMRGGALLALFASVGLAAQGDAPAGRAGEFARLEPVVHRAVDAVAPSVVRVETFGGARKAAPPRPGAKPTLVTPGFLQAQGPSTGVVLAPDGWILISSFALDYDPTSILVTLADGRTFTAERKGEDTSRGLALLKIEADGLQPPTWVDPAEVRVGQWAFALGRTFGGDHPSVHMGIVSAVGRLQRRAIQIDAYTSPANYGGPVIDLAGHVLGISVPMTRAGRAVGAEQYDSGIGFAATVADIGPLLERMKAGETLHQGWLGLAADPADLGPGAKIRSIANASPARRSGLQVGDRIVRVDGEPVRNSNHLLILIGRNMAGDPLEMTVAREGVDDFALTVFLGERPAAERAAPKPGEGDPFELPWEEGDPKDRGEGR